MAQRPTTTISGPVWVGRIINEDDRFVLIEVPKSDKESFTLDEDAANNRFVTFAWVRGLPWKETS